MIKEFPTLAVLTAASGRLLTQPISEEDNGIGQLYAVLGWMTGDTVFTHQLGRFIEECRPWIHQWHPVIAELDVEISRRCELGEAEMKALQQDMLLKFGKTIQLRKIPRYAHSRRNPIDELVEMRGSPEGVTVLVADSVAEDQHEKS